MYKIHQTRRFEKQYKKLSDQLAKSVNQAVESIADNPEIGERKKGDLSKLYVHKFRSNNQLYLLGYTKDDEVCFIWLESVGSHENFYRDLKRTL